MTNIITKLLCTIIVVLTLLSSCATYKEQQKNTTDTVHNSEVAYTIFIAGGLGNSTGEIPKDLSVALGSSLAKTNKNATLIFTGNNISEKLDNWESDKHFIDQQVELTKNFKGNTIFIPGNNEWKSYNTKQVERIEDYIKDQNLTGVSFFPENACPLERKVINDDLDLILVDSKWFVSNWERVENINKKCTNIVTRARFIEELEGYINDGQGKNIVIAMYHPVFSNGIYAGNQTINDHLKPLPVVGTLKETFMDLGSFSPDDLNSRRYKYLRVAVTALAKASDRVTVISGHDENLQYLSGGNIHQIISGSLGGKQATYLKKEELSAIGGSLDYEGKYAFGTKGFAKLDYFKDGSSKVTFYGENIPKEGVSMEVLKKFKEAKPLQNLTRITQASEKTKILENREDYEKNGFYKFLWGKRYRKYYGESVTAKVAYLDTLYGGLKVIKEGGGHQSFSLRLEDADGKQYAMRSLRKNALKFLKFKLPGVSYNQNDFKDTFAEETISDFFTTAHPYMQLTVNPLAKAVGVNHSDNQLLYIPKQNVLGEYNEDFGDELYFVERRPSKEQSNYSGYRRTINKEGKVKDFESSTDMLEKIKSDESFSVDQRDFIRARIFDMLIGDWDRHQDQWRWIEFEGEDSIKEFMPIPRDRDNAFPRFDGTALKAIKLFAPLTRSWQTYDQDIDNIKWLNNSGNKLDRALLTEYGKEVWREEAQIIQRRLTEKAIDRAFLRLPLEVRDATSNFIKESLKERLKLLDQYAVAYANHLNKIVAVRGTEKDDAFFIERMADGKTKVVVKRLFSDKEDTIIYERIFNKKETKEIWLYGLGDDDEFFISGTGSNYIKLKVIGGYGEDEFTVSNKKKLKVFDWKYEKTVFKEKTPATQLSNIYETNSYHLSYFEPNTNVIVPNAGFRTDDGFHVGLSDTYIQNGLNGNPFRQKHAITGNYYFEFAALELDYKGVFGNILPKWNLELNAYYTSDQYARNFFGFGNESINQEDDLGRDFNRTQIRQYKASVGLAFYKLRIKGLFESFQVTDNEDRFSTPENLNPEVFESQNYVGGEVSANYDRKNAIDFPTKAIYLGFAAGYKYNLNLDNNSFGYASLKLGFDYKLIPSGNLVFSTKAEYKTNIGDNFFFYHAPFIGGNNGLRGFRDERFSGDSYFYQSTDLKVRLKRYVTAVSPVTVGVYGGFDYGSVWSDGLNSNRYHTSQGGGFWISSLEALTLNIGFFNSVENNLLQVGFGLSF